MRDQDYSMSGLETHHQQLAADAMDDESLPKVEISQKDYEQWCQSQEVIWKVNLGGLDLLEETRLLAEAGRAKMETGEYVCYIIRDYWAAQEARANPQP